MSRNVVLVILCFFILFRPYCKSNDSHNEIDYKLSKSDAIRSWKLNHISHFRGDYSHENGTYYCRIILIFYHDSNLTPSEQMDCVFIEVKDMAEKPSVRVIQGLVYNKKKNSLSNGSFTIHPVEARFSGASKWIRGVVHKKMFYEITPIP